MSDSLVSHILQQQPAVIELQTALTAFAALGPENGGQGEQAKALYIGDWLRRLGGDLCQLDSPDERVASGLRPNLIYRRPGRNRRCLWLFAHTDVVPPGNPDAWEHDPWQVRQQDDFLYGRGVEDNQQAICSMLILAAALAELGIEPETGLGLVFMADEETGSRHGLRWLLNLPTTPFDAKDLYIVPDGGSPDGSLMEVAEKAQLWLRFVVTGEQCHASMPEQGRNSLVAASQLILDLNQLNSIFSRENPLFEPPRSTFVPSKHERNVDAINILPGRDEFYLDCRLLPGLSPEAVLAKCSQITNRVAADYGVAIEVEIAHRQNATATSPESPVALALAKAIEAIYHIRPRPCGIGGATVAAFLREAGFDAVVWSRIQNTCHQPNERSSISATLGDAAVFASILAQ